MTNPEPRNEEQAPVVHGEYVQTPDGQLWAFSVTAEAEVIKAAVIAQEAEGE